VTTQDIHLGYVFRGRSGIDATANWVVANEDDDELRPRIIRNHGSLEFLIVWERVVSDTNHDLYGRRHSIESGGHFPAAASRIELSASTDVRGADAVWDDVSELYRIVYSVGGEDVVVAHLDSTLAPVAYQTVMNGASGDSHDQPAIATRESAGESLLSYRVAVASPADLRLRGHSTRRLDD
jgi:hypothetical protein